MKDNLVDIFKLLIDSFPYYGEPLVDYAKKRQLLPHLEAFDFSEIKGKTNDQLLKISITRHLTRSKKGENIKLNQIRALKHQI
jgi:hypothetical protein